VRLLGKIDENDGIGVVVGNAICLIDIFFLFVLGFMLFIYVVVVDGWGLFVVVGCGVDGVGNKILENKIK
jgi:hypothetical protein